MIVEHYKTILAMKKNDVMKTVSVVSDKTQKVNVVHELDLHEMSVEEKALVGHLLLEGKELPHPLTHEALAALLIHANDEENGDEEMPEPPVMNEDNKKLNQEFLREVQAAGNNRTGRIAAMRKWVNALTDNLLAAARALLTKHKAGRAAGSVRRDWVAQGLLNVCTQASAAEGYCASTAHREAMKITTGSPLQLFLDGQYDDDLNAALIAESAWFNNPTKVNWVALRDAVRPKVVKNLRDLRRMLIEDSYVTNSMFEAMGQPDRPSGQRHPIPPPDYTPEVTIAHDPNDNSQLAITLKTPADKAIIGPNGLVGEVMLALAPPNVSPQDIHPDDGTLNWHSFLTTKAKFHITLPDYLRNKMLVLVARIVNKRNQKGNWGDVHTLQAT